MSLVVCIEVHPTERYREQGCARNLSFVMNRYQIKHYLWCPHNTKLHFQNVHVSQRTKLTHTNNSSLYPLSNNSTSTELIIQFNNLSSSWVYLEKPHFNLCLVFIRMVTSQSLNIWTCYSSSPKGQSLLLFIFCRYPLSILVFLWVLWGEQEPALHR